MITLIRSTFAFFLGRAHRSRFAAAAATLLALAFAPALMHRQRGGGRIIEGECRRMDG
jgi:hypothetical protein